MTSDSEKSSIQQNHHVHNSIPVIDVHTHILPPNIPNWDKEFGYEGFIGLREIKNNNTTDRDMVKGDNFFRRVQCNCFDHDVRKNEMKASSVTIQVLSTVPIMFNYWAKANDCLKTSQYINDHIADICNKEPDKFIGLGTLPMQDVKLACSELHRCLKIGLKGVEIGTNINGTDLDDECFEAFWKCVEDTEAVVFVHPWDMMGGKRMDKHWLSWLISMPAETATAISCMIFGGIYKRYPKIKVYYAHGGGAYIGIMERIQKGYDCRSDLFSEGCNPRDHINKIMVDSLTHDPEMIKLFIQKIGCDNIMIGSDYPFPLGEPDDVGRAVKHLFKDSLKTNLTSDGKQTDILKKICYENACKFFKIKEKFEVNQIDIKKKIETDITTILTDPISYSNDLSTDILVAILREFCAAFYSNNPLVENPIYNKMSETLRKRNSKHLFFRKES